MSTGAKLSAERRETIGKESARKLRGSGRVPAVLYGKGSETLSLSLDAHEARLLFESISVENTIVGLEIDGEKGPVQTLIREIQVHPYRPQLFHVDFYRIREGERLEVEIPVHLHGVPEGVRSSGGILQQVVHQVPVKCLPTMIPESIDIDVNGLEIGGSIHVSDLRLGEGVEVLMDADQTVCSVVAPKLEAAPAAEAAAPAEGAEGEAAAGEGAGESEKSEE
jgi:large subunit ribosomal protein L25